MPTLTVLTAKPHTQQTMRYVLSDGTQGSMYSTSKEFTYKDVQRNATVEREGMKALTRHVGPGLRAVTFTQTLANRDYKQSIESVVRRFTDAGASPRRIRFTGGSSPYEQPCWWVIDDLSVSVEQRAENNTPSRVKVSWSLKEWVDVTTKIARTPPPPAPPAPARPVAQVQRMHRVVSGDHLWGIAGRYLGNSLRWPEVFNMNRAIIGGNPNYILPGQVLRIPA